MTVETVETVGQEADQAMPLQLTCPNCGATDLVMEQGARFCEGCGYGVDEPVTGEEEPSEFLGPKPCVSCGGTEIDAEGYCTDCGDLQPRRRDRMEVDLGVVAGISDRGLRHHRNEDSMALRPALGLDGQNLVVAVVCDGVSTSERPDEASAAAVSAAAKLLLTAIAAGTPVAEPGSETVPETETESESQTVPTVPTVPNAAHTEPVETAVMELVMPQAAAAPAGPEAQTGPEARPATGSGTEPEAGTAPDPAGTAGAGVRIGPADLRLISRHAVADADRAVSELARDADHGNPPACTYVSAIVGGEVTVAWLGDSRAYWLDERGTSRALTRDDAAEGSHAIEAWLGADSGAPEPHLARFTPDGPGAVLVCSDGLWNYVEKAADLAALALPAALTDPFGAAARLVRKALDSGGHDNITAVLIPYPVQAPAEGAGKTGASQQP